MMKPLSMNKGSVRFILFISCILLLYLLHSHIKEERAWNQSVYLLPEIQQIKVVTYNIQYGRGQDGKVDLQRTIDTLKELDPDIVSLQEIERYGARSGFQDQVHMISQALEMNAVFSPSLSYPGIYYGNAILSRFPIQDFSRVSLPSSYEHRSAVLAHIRIDEQKTIQVLNTHLGLDQKERARDIRTIHEIILTTDSPIIVTGDLNSTPKKKEYDIWTEHFLVKSNEGQRLQTYRDRDWQIDYIFHSPHFVTLDTWTVSSDASDHFPVFALLELR
jgi:endonuclease/exonuclease/phosphatase family metal-dependent hydrolase